MTVDGRTGCPASETLARAASPDADRQLREAVADHLITCATCAEEFRVAQAVANWADAAQPRPQLRTSAGPWILAVVGIAAVTVLGIALGLLFVRQQDQRIRAIATSAATRPQQLEQQLAESQRTIEELRQRLAQSESPQINAPIVELTPSNTTRGGSAAAPHPRIPADARQIVLVLNSSNPSPGAAQDVEIVDAAEKIVWRGSGLTQSAHGTLTLIVPATLIGPQMRIKVYEPAHHRLLDQYGL